MLETIKKRQRYLPDDVQESAVSGNVISGGLWSGADTGFSALISFVRSIILARLLAPADFGIVSIAMVFTQFVLIFANFGFTASVIYHRDLTTEDISTCWWGNFTVDLIATLVCISFALLSERFVKTPQTPWVIVILSTQFFIASIGAINAALLQRLFKFKTTTIIKMSGATTSFTVTLILVIFFNMGVYGLAVGTVFGTMLTTTLYFLYLPWLPSMAASLRRAKKHLSYGSWFLGVNVITYANANLDKTVIGSYLDNTQLGYFEYASRFPSMVVQELGQVLNRVLFSAFSNLQGNFQEMARLLRKLFRYNTLLVFPMLFGLASVAHDFTLVLYGEKWEPMIIPMQILCIYGSIRIFTNPLYALANGIGKPNMPFKWAAFALPINGIIVYLLARFYGLEGVAIGKGILALYFLFTLGVELSFSIQASFPKLLMQAFPATLCSCLMVLCVFGVKHFALASLGSTITSLVIQIVVGGVAYISALHLFFPTDMRQLLGIFSKKKIK
jgi:O-antigen/teichoic acid export membrane protein